MGLNTTVKTASKTTPQFFDAPLSNLLSWRKRMIEAPQIPTWVLLRKTLVRFDSIQS